MFKCVFQDTRFVFSNVVGEDEIFTAVEKKIPQVRSVVNISVKLSRQSFHWKPKLIKIAGQLKTSNIWREIAHIYRKKQSEPVLRCFKPYENYEKILGT